MSKTIWWCKICHKDESEGAIRETKENNQRGKKIYEWCLDCLLDYQVKKDLKRYENNQKAYKQAFKNW